MNSLAFFLIGCIGFLVLLRFITGLSKFLLLAGVIIFAIMIILLI